MQNFAGINNFVENFFDIQASFRRNTNNLFGFTAEKIDDFFLNFFDVGGRKVDFVDNGNDF